MFSDEMKNEIVEHFLCFTPDERDDWGVSVDNNLEGLGMWFDSHFNHDCPDYYQDAVDVAGEELDFSEVREAMWELLEEHDKWEPFMARLKIIEIGNPMESYSGFDSEISMTIADYLEELEYKRISREIEELNNPQYRYA